MGNHNSDLARGLSHKEADAAAGAREGLQSGRERQSDSVQPCDGVLTCRAIPQSDQEEALS